MDLFIPQCSFSGCDHDSQTVVRFKDGDSRWLMEYCGPHAGYVVTHYPNNPKCLGPNAFNQHLSALQSEWWGASSSV